jgi:uncharacterized membrane protein
MRSDSALRAPALTVGIGAIAGVRPMMALAVVSYAAKRGWIRPGHSPLASQISGQLHKRIAEFALSEFVAEKLPFARNRISVVSLGSRIAAGAVCGAAVHTSMRRPADKGILLGVLGALAGAVAGHHLRERLKREMPDLTVALIEDALAIGGAFIVSLSANGRADR